MLQEFKKFIAKGNVIDLAVGLILATYFGAIVKSLVDDIIMPPIGMILGGVDFADLKYVISEAVGETPEVSINYGSFINHIITFLIVGFAVFMIVRSYNQMKERFEKKEAAIPAAPAPPTKEEVLLAEIRDLLKR
jgi:large conductance mechanosensitive channel